MGKLREIHPPPLLTEEQRKHVQTCIEELQKALDANNLLAVAGFWIDRTGEALPFDSNTESALGPTSHGIMTLTVHHHTLMAEAMEYEE